MKSYIFPKKAFLISIFAFLLLFSACSNPIKTNYDFYVACADNDVQNVAKYLKKHPDAANATLAETEYRQLAEYLVSVQKSRWGVTELKFVQERWLAEYRTFPIILASGLGHLEIVRQLVASHADLNVADDTTENALMANLRRELSKENQREITEALLDGGINVNADNEAHQNALYLAFSCYCSADIIKALLEHGADFGDSDEDEYYHDKALYSLCALQSAETTELLFHYLPQTQRMTDFVFTYYFGKTTTPLLEVISKGKYDVAKVFLKCGALERTNAYYNQLILALAENAKDKDLGLYRMVCEKIQH